MIRCRLHRKNVLATEILTTHTHSLTHTHENEETTNLFDVYIFIPPLFYLIRHRSLFNHHHLLVSSLVIYSHPPPPPHLDTPPLLHRRPHLLPLRPLPRLDPLPHLRLPPRHCRCLCVYVYVCVCVIIN